MTALRFALRGLRRDWRSGDLRLLAIALTLCVAAITAVGFFTERVEKALQRQGNLLLAADLVVESPEPLPTEFADHARSSGLETAQTLSFPSVVMGSGSPQLVQVKAVDAHYPLRGDLLLQDAVGGPTAAADGAPPGGRIWVEPRLVALLGAALGERVELGAVRFELERLVALEPDRGGNLFQLAPRVMMNRDDIPATGLVSPASRVQHRLLVAGTSAAVERFESWIRPRLPNTARVLTSADARPEFRAALEKGGRFLALASLICVLVAGAAIALSSRRLVERQASAVAIMRCLGASSRFLRNELSARLGLLLAVTTLLGSAAGFLAQWVLAALVGQWFSHDLPATGALPLLSGAATAVLTLGGFALPALWRLPTVPPLRVLRRDLGAPGTAPWLMGAAMFGALSLLLIWQIEDLQLSLRVLGAAAALVAGLGLAALALVRLAALLQSRVRGIARFALASVSRHGVTTGVQIGGFGLGAMAILLLTVVRLDLLRAWENTLPPDTPNRFLINVLPDQADAVDAYLAANGIAGSGLHPMVRGRLVALNGRKIDPDAYASPRAQRLARREFNLSWGTEMQPDNRLVAGQWPSGAHPAAGFSVEQGIAESLGIRLGDRLTYRIAGREIDAPVTSLRSVQWDSFNVNFFVIGTPGLLQDQPATYITSFHLPSTKEAVTVELVRRFPNVTLLDVSALMQQVRGVIDRGSAALEYVFAFTLLAGALVLFAGIQAGAESRRAEAAILRTLGANRRQLLGATLVEFAVLGLLAGLLASLGAHAAGYLLADRVFGLEYGFSPRLWLAGIVLPAVGVALAGLAATWSQVTRSPLWSLRRSE